MKFFIYSKNKKSKDGRSFRSYWTYMYLLVKGQEEKGKQRKSVNVSFLQGVNHSSITRGIVEGDFDAPFIYEIKKDEKTGKDKYPTLWVKRVDSFEEKTAKHQQSDFILEDEGETEEAEINAADDPKLPF